MNDIELNNIVNQITNALEALHNPSSSSDLRRQSQEFLEEIKHRPNAYAFALILITKPNEIVKHFGLHIIENLVKNQWITASDMERESVKREILQIVALIQPKEQKFIKEKLVTIIVEIVKRDWPQRWATLLDQLVQISSVGEAQQELVLLTFGALPHEIIVDGHPTSSGGATTLPDQRKKDLMNGIHIAVTMLFEYFYKMLESKYTLYKQDPTNQANIHLISVLLNSLLSYIDWIPVKLIFDHKLDFIFCQLLQDIPFRITACECLLLFLSRKGRVEEKAELLTPFNMLDRFIQAMSISSSFESDYTFHKRMAQTLTILGTTHLTVYTKGALPNNYNTYLQLMVQMLQHPSILLTSLAVPFWTAFLKHTEIIKIPFIDQLLTELLKISISKILKVGNPDKPDSCEQSKYSTIDFTTNKEWSQFFGTIRSRFIDTTKLITSINPELTFTFALSKVTEMIPVIQAATLQLSHEQTMILESISFFLEIVVQSLPALFFSKETQYPNSIKATETLLKLLLDTTFNDPNALSFQTDCIKPFTCYYSHHPESIQYLLHKLVPLIPFKSTYDTGDRLSGPTLHARRRIITCLINLSMELTDKIIIYVPQLYQSVQQLFQQGSMTETEKVMLFHLLMVFVNEIPNFQQALTFLKELMLPIITIWCSSDLTNAIQSPESLIRYLGLDTDGAMVPREIVDKRKQLQYVVASLQIFWKKSQLPHQVAAGTSDTNQGYLPFISNGTSYPSKWPISTFIKEVLPNVVTLLQTIHSLWDPSKMALLHPYYSPIFKLDETITAALLGQPMQKDSKTEPENIKFVRNLFDTIRDSCYEIIGYGFSHSDELFELPNLPKILYDSLFSSIKYCENRHLKLILRQVITFLIKYCPQKLQAQIIDPLMPPLLTLLFNRIKSGWEVVANRSLKETKEDSEIVEIIDDKILRDLTLEFIIMVKEFPTHPNILANFDIISPTIYGLTACLLCPDHLVVDKATISSEKLIEAVGEDTKYQQILGNEMFGVCLKVLIQNKIPDLAQDYIALIRLIYTKMYKSNKVCQQVLLLLPNITQNTVNEFDRNLAQARTDKYGKQLFKNLLKDVIGINLQKLKKQSILDLPEKLFVAKVSGAPAWDDTNNNNLNNNGHSSTLSDLFS